MEVRKGRNSFFFLLRKKEKKKEKQAQEGFWVEKRKLVRTVFDITDTKTNPKFHHSILINFKTLQYNFIILYILEK